MLLLPIYITYFEPIYIRVNNNEGFNSLTAFNIWFEHEQANHFFYFLEYLHIQSSQYSFYFSNSDYFIKSYDPSSIAFFI